MIAAGAFGFQFMVEMHHVIKSATGGYFPGAVTALPIVVLGVVIVATAWREFGTLRTAPAAMLMKDPVRHG
jgi:hypothetical protein